MDFPIENMALQQYSTDQVQRCYSGGRKYEKLGGLSVAILLVVVQCAKHTQSMQSMLSF